MMHIDLKQLRSGLTYENTYGTYMHVLRSVAESHGKVEVADPPMCWIPLLYYFGADITLSCDTYFHPEIETGPMHYTPSKATVLALCQDAARVGRLRELVESFEGMRPELVDALYKSDREWLTVGRRHTSQKEFVVAANGSFQRPEVLEYLARLEQFNSTALRCVLVPCAADKPYPAPLHRDVRDTLSSTGVPWEMVIFTGVLGMVPEPLWEYMPMYDSGMPNQWRVQESTTRYFSRHRFKSVLVYGDFYNTAVANGLVLGGWTCLTRTDGRNVYVPTNVINFEYRHAKFATPVEHYTEYLDLRSEENLKHLLHSAQWLLEREAR